MNKYEIIYNALVEDIKNQTFAINTSLPSEGKLGKRFEASRITIRRALDELEQDGYIRKQQGKESIIIRRKITAKTVLLVVPDVFRYIFSELIKSIESTLRQNNISLLIGNSFNEQSIERSIIRNHFDIVDAIIFEPAQVNNTRYDHSKTYKKLNTKPTICLNSKIPNSKLPSLTLDDQKSMELISNYVLSQDKKRILVFAKTDDLQGSARLQGIHKVFNKSNTDYLVVEFNTNNDVEQLTRLQFLYINYKPDCLMFYNDEYAYKFLTKYNINPLTDNLLITGFDNTDYSNGYPYKFISPNHPKGKMGEDAANMIIDLLNKKSVDSIVYEPEIDFDK